ncbi:GNAT family N-acetyltransferase [Lysinibacillus fusiformis]|uniref:GNAT family N-acetyltransferase n=1 Tax=Lysinibacillus fusiformis TaxID=28031 RepID=UPI002E21613D|nr:GNAT family N-acetyltransferase [Lysinibacillus fusiformis]MED4886346.1 GNAT family N-acetyltransferase [Lysinibacillus fusiformis]
MDVQIIQAPVEQKNVLRHLLELYTYDFSEFDPLDVNEQGLYGYEYFDHYWTEPERFPFLIKVNGNYAGFALVRKITQDGENYEPYVEMAEFFVMKKYRKDGVGRQVAFYLFDSFPGKWRIAEREVNVPAQKFWRKIISEYTKGNYKEIQKADWEGPIQMFFTGQ